MICLISSYISKEFYFSSAAWALRVNTQWFLYPFKYNKYQYKCVNPVPDIFVLVGLDIPVIWRTGTISESAEAI